MLSDKSGDELKPTQLVMFDYYNTFIADLYECYKVETLPLALYGRLMEKTSLVNKKSVKKHVQVCLDFFKLNKNAVLEKNHEKIVSNFEYSNTIFIDIKSIIKKTDEKDVVDSIWRHLLKILHVIDPDCEADITLEKEQTKEEEFLGDMFNKIKEETSGIDLDSDGDPLEVMSKMMQSGVISGIMNDMNNNVRDGNLDIAKMMGMVSGLLNKTGQNDTNLLNDMIDVSQKQVDINSQEIK